MYCRILTTQITDIDSLTHDPCGILKNAKEGAIAIFINNIPAFYVITPERLAQLIEIEANVLHQANDIMLDDQLFETQKNKTPITPIGKFVMYSGWQPDDDFQHLAALWGIKLTQPVTAEEITAFTDYWKVEGKAFYHIQWQLKFAHSIQIRRTHQKYHKHDINMLSEPDKQIPHGFRGAK